jgi:hypothetical protein
MRVSTLRCCASEGVAVARIATHPGHARLPTPRVRHFARAIRRGRPLGNRRTVTASACTTVRRNHVVTLPQSPIRPTAEVVCLVDVDPSLLPVYARTTKGESCYFEPCKGKHAKPREGADVEEALAIVVLHEQLNREAISGTPQRPVRRKRRSQFHHMTGISRLSI